VSVPHLRPRSAPELIDASFQLARRHYRPLLLLSAVVAIPSLLIGLINAWFFPAPPAASELGLRAFRSLPLAIAGLAWAAIGFGALVISAATAYTTGTALDADHSIRQALARGGSLVGANFLAYLRALGALLLVMIPLAVIAGVLGVALGQNPLAGGAVMIVALVAAVGCFVAVLARYTNVTAVVMLEGARATAAVRRARTLAEGSLPRIVALLLLVFGLFTVMSLTLSFTLQRLLGNEMLASALVGVASLPAYPVFACVLALLYYDLRIRKEGYDIEVMARELEGGDAPAAAGAAGQPSF